METVIKIACKDEKGLVHKITGVLFAKLVNVTQTNEFVDEVADRFFMRVSFTGIADVKSLRQEIIAVLPADAEVEVIPPAKKRVLICVTKEHHCLGDLLIKSQFEDMPFFLEIEKRHLLKKQNQLFPFRGNSFSKRLSDF